MKKLYTLIAAAAISGSVFAQQASTAREIEGFTAPNTQSEATVDSIFSPFYCSNTSLYVIGSTNGGYMAGTNGSGDKEKGMLIMNSSPVKVTDVVAFIGEKEQVVNGNIVAYVYDVDTTSGSITLAGTSAAVAVSSIDTTTPSLTTFHFANAPVVNGIFLMTVQVDNGGDTIGLVSSIHNSTCGGFRAFEKLSDDSWSLMANRWANSDIWLYMFAVVDDNISTEENILDRQSARAFPNPANDNINITYHINGSSEVVISVMDIQGRVVMTQTENQVEGRQVVEMNTSALSAGTYFYSVQSGSDVMSGKFVVRH